MPERAFAVADATVRLDVPEDAEFDDLDGLPDGHRNLTWTLAGGFLTITSGFGPDDTPEAMLAIERAEAEALTVLADDEVPLVAPGARRVAWTSARLTARRTDAAPGGGVVERDAAVEERVSDFVWAPGPDGTPVVLGYRAAPDAPARAELARILDGARVQR